MFASLRSLRSPRSIALPLLIWLTVFSSSACKGKEDRWADAAAAAQSAAESAPKVERQDTGTFNTFFPESGGDETKRVFTADKEGYAEAKLTKDGKDVALLAITDMKGKDAETKKYEEAKEKLAAYPVATFGKNKTMVLVKNRYQVSVSSPTLDHEARKALIAKFDLAGLSAL